jgi:outer membrane immunogenic protein
MKKISIATALIAGAMFAGGAMAADMKAPAPMLTKAPMMAPVNNWTGCYLGGGGGYGLYDLATQLTFAGGVVNVPLDQGGRGWFGTVQVGCDYQIASNWVVGAFGDWDWSHIHGAHTGQDTNVGLIQGDMDLNRTWSAGGRIGYLVTPSFLTYFSGGWTQAHFGQATYAGPTGVLTGLAAPAASYNGYFLGSGVEYAIGFLPELYWKTEYRFADYSAQNLAVFVTATGLPNGARESTHPYVQTIRSELVWRINWGH